MHTFNYILAIMYTINYYIYYYIYKFTIDILFLKGKNTN